MIHNALPDFLLPYKHYQTQDVQDVYDDVVDESDKDYEDYPCEKTMKLWKKWIKENILRIESMIRSVGYRYLDFSTGFLKYQGSLFGELRKRLHSCWLHTMIRWIYNSGGYLNAVY